MQYTLMFPILLVSREEKKTADYIAKFIKSHQFGESRIVRLRPSPNVIRIGQIRQIKQLMSRAERQRKLFIIYDFSTAKEETQNSFLKTLEEQAEKAQFIIIVKDETEVLATVRSRCKVEKIKGAKEEKEGGFKNLQGKSLARLFFDYSGVSRDKSVEIVDELLFQTRRLLKDEEKSAEQLKEILSLIKEGLSVRRLIERNNLNPQAAVDHLLIRLAKIFS